MCGSGVSYYIVVLVCLGEQFQLRMALIQQMILSKFCADETIFTLIIFLLVYVILKIKLSPNIYVFVILKIKIKIQSLASRV